MEKRSRRRIRDLVARPASLGLSENEIGCARISMMARNTNVPFKGRIQKRKTYHLQIITFRLQRAAGPYRSATSGPEQVQQKSFDPDRLPRNAFSMSCIKGCVSPAFWNSAKSSRMMASHDFRPLRSADLGI